MFAGGILDKTHERLSCYEATFVTPLTNILEFLEKRLEEEFEVLNRHE